jgi:CheY-like chemotaxis protein/curved DNA-binding protein CbpA
MTKRILVVDDDRNIGQILHASFSSKGYETLVSRNGEDAIAKFRELQPNLVLLDVLLPKMNGWEVCRKLKGTDLGAKTPIILMSAVYKNYKMQQDAVTKYGADDFVEKPFQLSRLLDKIESLIGAGSSDAVPVREPAPETESGAPAAEAEAAAPAAPPPDVSREPIMMEGDLTTIGIAELLHDIYVMGKSGYLLISHDDIEKEIAIKDGYPVSIRTTLEEEYFGNFLVRKRIITPEQRDESVERMKESVRLQGTVLIEMGAITPHELVKYLKMQMREKLFEIFSWRDGNYKFNENDDITGDVTTLEMSTANVINEGVRQHFDLDRLLPIIDEWRAKFVRPGSNLHYRFQDIDFTPREQAIDQYVDGVHTVGEALGELDLDRVRAQQIMYTLVVCEMVELHDKPLDRAETLIARQPDVDVDAEFEASEPPAPPEPPEPPPPKAEEADEAVAPLRPAAPPAPKPAAPPPPKPAAAPPPKAEKKAPPKRADEEAPAADADPLAADADEAEQRARVLRVYNRVSDGDYFQILGVTDNPTEGEVRIAYHKIAKEFHPDRFFGKASEEVRSQVEEIFRRITEAYETLNTQEKIAAYIKKLDAEAEVAPKTDTRVEGVKKIIMAEQFFQNGKQYLKDKRFSRAGAEFRKAIEISSNEAEYLAYYGWALYNVPKERDLTADDKKLFSDQSESDLQFNGRESLNRAIQINPRSERAYLFLGSVYKSQGLKEFAEKQFEKALICNPNCIEALRELRLIKLQDQKVTQKKTFLDKIRPIFKRK